MKKFFVLCAVAALAACGGSDKPADGPTTTSTTTTATPAGSGAPASATTATTTTTTDPGKK